MLFDENDLPFGGSILSIRSLLQLNNRNKRLAITYSHASEGKIMIAINIAMAFTKLGNTLLIDCDLRNSSNAGSLNLKSRQGLYNSVFMGHELSDCLYKNLSIRIDNFTCWYACKKPI